jgi:hypothetical protein
VARLNFRTLLTILSSTLLLCFQAHGDPVQKPDTLSIYLPDEELYSDTLDIGPEFDVLDDAFLIDEDALPSFGEAIEQFTVPFAGKVISRYGMRRGRMHTGTDIKLELGDTVVASYHGIVTRASAYYGYGRLVVINHSHGLETYYAHLSSLLVKTGDTITAGQAIGLGGRTGRATGTHLHFEIREKGSAYNPELVFDFENNTLRPEIHGKQMLAELVQKPRVTERKHIVDMGETPERYTVRPGDSLWLISRKFQVTINELCELNNLTSKSVLRIGSVLRIF